MNPVTAPSITVTKDQKRIRFFALGQSGFVVEALGQRLVIDPYLSDSVAEKFGEDLRRQIAVVKPAAEFTGVDWILLTHAHLDHTDPETLRSIAIASPGARFVAPFESRTILDEMGLKDREIQCPPVEWKSLAADVNIRALPAAHPDLERNPSGEWRYVGYLLRFGQTTIYHAGDTVPHPEIIAALNNESIDVALIPINERNIYRERAGIVGNMSVREAFAFAAEIGAAHVIPIHWDLFAPNLVYPEEVAALYQRESPPFSLEFLPAGSDKSFPLI